MVAHPPYVVQTALAALLLLLCSIPSSAQLVRGCRTLDSVARLFGDGYQYTVCSIGSGYGYACSKEGVDVFDLASDTLAPIASLTGVWSEEPFELKARGKNLVVVMEQEVVVVDVADPAVPHVRHRQPLPTGFDTSAVEGADLIGDDLYFGVSSSRAGGTLGALYRVDLAAPSPTATVIYRDPYAGVDDVEATEHFMLVHRFYSHSDYYDVYRIAPDGQLHDGWSMWNPNGFNSSMRAVSDSTIIIQWDDAFGRHLDLYRLLDPDGPVPMASYLFPWEAIGRVVLSDSVVVLSKGEGTGLISALLHGDTLIEMRDSLMFDPARVYSERGYQSYKSSLHVTDGHHIMRLTGDGVAFDTLDAEGRIGHRGTCMPMRRALAVTVVDDMAYALTSNTLETIFIARPEQPLWIASMPLISGRLSAGTREDLYAYDSIVTAIDIVTPSLPRIVACCSLGRNVVALNVAVRDSIIAAACGVDGLVIMRRDHASLEVVARHAITASDLLWKGDTLLVLGGDTLTAWTFDDRTIGSADTLLVVNDATALCRVDDTLLVGRSLSIARFDIGNIANPRPLPAIAREKFDGPAWRLWSDGHRMVAYSESGVVQTASMPNDRMLSMCDTFYTGFDVGSFSVMPDHLLVASGTKGLRIFRFGTTGSVADRHQGSTSVTISIAPNPVDDLASVQVTLPRSTEARLDLYDRSGRLLRSVDAGRLPAGEHALTLDVRDLADGVYYCALVADDSRATAAIHVRSMN